MLILELLQVLFGLAALVACAIASRAALRRDKRHVGLYLFIAGALALVFFLTIASVRYEMLMTALLLVFTGALLATSAPIVSSGSSRPFGDDSTLGRRPR
jgi:predicted MFS family arabinose efflux permease